MKIQSADDIVTLVNELGFLPYFANDIPGFSVEEFTPKELWFTDLEGPWEWKGPVIRKAKCAYGKFFNGKAGFISKKWFPDFCNFRRDGYDYDSRESDGLGLFYKDKLIYETLLQKPNVTSKELKRMSGFGKGGAGGFDTSITRLQMLGYVTIIDFDYSMDKNGNFYGWGISRYSTPEHHFGKYFANHVYERKPEESKERIIRHLVRKLHCDRKEIEKILK